MNDNYFQDTLLPLHIKLQELYREKCGDWQEHDRYWCPDSEMVKYQKSTPTDSTRYTRLPGLEELWEMCSGITNRLVCYGSCWGFFYPGDSTEAFVGETPTEVILKALCSQENIILGKYDMFQQEMVALKEENAALKDRLNLPSPAVILLTEELSEAQARIKELLEVRDER